MIEPLDVRAFLAGETRLAKSFLALAALSTLLVVASWFPHGFYVYLIIFPLHLAVMGLMLVLFVMLARRNFATLFRTSAYVVAAPIPKIYWPCLGISLAYLLAVFLGYAANSQPGESLGPSADFRIFSSFSLFLSLGSFGFSHSIGRRQRTKDAA